MGRYSIFTLKGNTQLDNTGIIRNNNTGKTIISALYCAFTIQTPHLHIFHKHQGIYYKSFNFANGSALAKIEASTHFLSSMYLTVNIILTYSCYTVILNSFYMSKTTNIIP